ncbi:Ribosome modulation factor [Alloalcanivorax dieselolei B5]|uniref:Ribosome modulation factor n=2 Tax=Alloalcanivorax dieselolei TaxID=285091 RepID=K0CEJ2_ALCDB|nr:Ribosome modulation factor [Alloalcanivorax dieselolei B5]
MSMKRQKRSREERAYSRGYQAGYKGKSKDFCPFDALQARSSWLNGWREGHVDQLHGLVGVAGIHNLKDLR